MIDFYMPSKGRSDIFDPENKGSTFNSLYGLGYKINIVVYQEEYLEYKKSARKNRRNANIVVCDGGKGIAFKRWFIGQHAEKVGLEKFIMCDDDLKFLVRRGVKLFPLVGAGLMEMVDKLAFDLQNYAHAGVSSRAGNNHIKEDYVENARLIQLQAYRVKEYNLVQHQRIKFMEDFDVTLQLLKMGLKNKVYYKWAKSDVTNSKGGCSDYRTVKNQSECAEKLAKLHPDCVRVVQKNGDGAYGKRKDVVVQWKKAYEIGLKNGKT